MDRTRSLLRHGIFLFLLALFTGLAVPAFKNQHMALAAHLNALMSGIFLVALAATWSKIGLSSRAEPIAYWLLVACSYVNWATTCLGAAWGTSKVTPLGGAGFSGTPLQENIVVAILSVMVVALIGAIATMLWAATRPAR